MNVEEPVTPTCLDPADAVVRASYSARAQEYIDRLGRMDVMSPVDQRDIADWATGIQGPILDAGCGPGHWTEYLRQLGANVEGIDVVPEFVGSARQRFPQVTFRLGTLDAIPIKTGDLAGLLAWYSVIHVAPDRLPAILGEFARCLTPGGSLLLGFFEGPRVEPFEHAVTTAYFWPVEELSCLLREAGLEVVQVHQRTDPGSRPHAAIEAKTASIRRESILTPQEVA